MDLWIAARFGPDGDDYTLGAFSSLDKAQDACQRWGAEVPWSHDNMRGWWAADGGGEFSVVRAEVDEIAPVF